VILRLLCGPEPGGDRSHMQAVLTFSVKASIWNSLSSVRPKSPSHFACAS
jgi:hypothetical protein